MKRIPSFVDSVSGRVAVATKPFMESRIGKLFQSIVLLGPLTFIPTIWTAWTSPDIDSLRTITWPLMVIVNISAWLLVSHDGNWRMRIASLVWIVVVALVWIATLVR